MKSDWNKPASVHLATPSFAPPVAAAGLMFLFWGAVTSWMVSALGLVAIGFACVLWVRGVQPHKEVAGARVDRSLTAAAQSVVKEGSRGGEGLTIAAGPWVHRCAVLLALCAFALVISGGLVTSTGTVVPPALRLAHIVVGAAAGLLALGLAIQIRGVAWALLAVVLVEAALGSGGAVLGALHAFLAQILFASAVAVALLTSGGWKKAPEFADDMPKPSLRTLAMVAAGMVVVQVALGAAVRHKLMGAGLHITFALLVALVVVTAGVLVSNHCAEHKTLRPCAVALMVITGAQVFLGFGAFIARIMTDTNTPPVVIITVAHVTTGALTLAATVVLTLQLRRHLRPAAAKKGAVVSS